MNNSFYNKGNLENFLTSRKLSEDQKEVFRAIVNSDGRNHYVGGNPGTGKSYLLNSLKMYLGKDLTITSTTGISALNVSGQTLHSYMGFYHVNMNFDELVSNIVAKNKKRFNKTKYLVIEECSMCDGFIFSLLEYVLRISRGDPRPFGNVKIILFGDFMQLPPVNNYGFLFQTDAWKAGDFKIHILTHPHRQTDKNFYKVLQECRTGQLSTEGYNFLKEREFPLEEVDENIVRMFATNAEVDSWNNHKYRQIKNEQEMIYYAEDDAINPKFDGYFDNNSLVPKELKLKPKSRVMLLRNVDYTKGLVNGSIGTVVKVERHQVVVQFDNGILKECVPETWEYMIDGRIIATRTQIPLRLCWAINFHKSQGQTLDCAYIDLKKIFAPGQAYVALSRLRTLKGLYLTNLSKRSFFVMPDALNFYTEAEELLEKEKAEIEAKKILQSSNKEIKYYTTKETQKELFNQFVKNSKSKKNIRHKFKKR